MLLDELRAEPRAQIPPIWEFRLADFLVCARQDVHGLFILSPTARLAWELLEEGQSLEDAAGTFAQACGISNQQAFEDVSGVWEQWSSGLLAPGTRADAASDSPFDSGSTPLVFSDDYLVFGRTVRLRVYDADVAWDLAPRVEPYRARSEAVGSGAAVSSDADTGAQHTVIDVSEIDGAFHVFVDGAHVSSENSVFAARVAVLQEFLKASGPQDWVAVLHAGACGTESHCIVFPAASHSGKTTLAAALLHRGLTFYGDDSVPLERGSFQIHPMPFALMMREESWPAVSGLFPELGGAAIVDRWGEKVRYLAPPLLAERFSPTAAAMVFPEYRAGAETEFQSLRTFDALLRLKESGFWLEHDQGSIGSFLEWFGSVPCYGLTYSDLGDAADILCKLLPASS